MSASVSMLGWAFLLSDDDGFDVATFESASECALLNLLNGREKNLSSYTREIHIASSATEQLGKMSYNNDIWLPPTSRFIAGSM
jgi:hypothetical protein